MERVVQMKTSQQWQEWYIGQMPPSLAEAFQRQTHPALWEDITPPEATPMSFSWMRHRRKALEESSRDRSFSRTGGLELWEKSRLLSLEDVEAMSLEQQEEVAACMILNAAIDCDDPQARVTAALAFPPGPFTRPLIRQLFRVMSREEKEQAFHQLLETICEEEQTEEALRLKLELWAEHPGENLTSALLKSLLDKCFHSETLLRALLQCVGKNPHNQDLLADWLRETNFPSCSPRLQQAMMDYCGIQASPRTYCLLLDWEEEMTDRVSVEDWIPEYLSLTIADCRRQLTCEPVTGKNDEAPAFHQEGMTLAQFMFYGDLMLPGKANSGGIATLLRTLGDTLSEQPLVDHVYTFMMMPCDERAGINPLTTPLCPGHTLVRVPVFFNETCSPELFQEKEYDIGHTLERILHLLQLDPDVFHMRYADNASLAAATLAKRRGKKGVFTLTPDPHRNIRTLDETQYLEDKGDHRQRTAAVERLMIQLNKVRAAEDILRQCDGVLGIGTQELEPQLTAYFPQLKERRANETLRFQMIPEGIRLRKEPEMGHRPLPEGAEAFSAPEEDPWPLLAAPGGKHRLAHHRKQLPVMMTVGRLDPVKGQMTLLEAWSDARLWQAYNLVLIGGDHQKPDTREKMILRDIDAFMSKHPHLQGGFCHLERMDNEPLRRLQESLAKQETGERPHLYIAPSIKEEFGLSIIEAMAAGLLAAGPRSGGVGSYVNSGENGFLLETGSAALLRDELVEMLITSSRTREEWWAIAAQGKATVEARFDIQGVAAEFAAFYREVLNPCLKGDGNNE